MSATQQIPKAPLNMNKEGIIPGNQSPRRGHPKEFLVILEAALAPACLAHAFAILGVPGMRSIEAYQPKEEPFDFYFFFITNKLKKLQISFNL